MQGWKTSYLGLRDLPRELSEFELQAFFSFGRDELEVISRRRGENHKLGLALHIGFVRMSGRPLNSVRAVPARAMLRERTRNGLQAARKEGRIGGRRRPRLIRATDRQAQGGLLATILL